MFLREVGSVNSPLGAKLSCPSPNTSDSQNNLKSSERVIFYVCFLFDLSIEIGFSLLLPVMLEVFDCIIDFFFDFLHKPEHNLKTFFQCGKVLLEKNKTI